VPAAEQQLLERDEFLLEIKEMLLHAHVMMKGNYDKHHREVVFQVGDWVWLCLHHRLAATLTDQARGKLAPKFYGPFQVLERIGAVAYKLALPPQTRIHNVFLLRWSLSLPSSIVVCCLSLRRSCVPISTAACGKLWSNGQVKLMLILLGRRF
jgi:hypothetical protein